MKDYLQYEIHTLCQLGVEVLLQGLHKADAGVVDCKPQLNFQPFKEQREVYGQAGYQ